MHRHSVWRQGYSVKGHELLRVLTSQEGYHASGFRMVHSQAFSKHIWRAIVDTKPNILHLTRENVLRQAASLVFHRMVRAHKAPFHPVHTFNLVEPPQPMTIQPHILLTACRELMRQSNSADSRMRKARLPVLTVKYGEMVGGEGKQSIFVELDVARKICGHIGVCEYPLTCELKRVHQHPLKAMIANWAEVEKAVATSEFARHLGHEMAWVNIKGRWTVKDGR